MAIPLPWSERCAAQRQDGAIELAPDLKGGAADKVADKLLTQGSIEEIPARSALSIWRRDETNGHFALRITSRGLAAIGVADGSTLLKAEKTRNTEQRADPARDKPARRVTTARRKKTGNEALRLSAKPRRSDSKQALVLEDPSLTDAAPGVHPATTIALPWTAPRFGAVKGVLHEPGAKPVMKPESRDVLLTAIAKARGWIDDIRLGRIASFAEIAAREALGERHIRLLAPLAFLSPRIIKAIVDGTAPADLTVTSLAKALRIGAR